MNALTDLADLFVLLFFFGMVVTVAALMEEAANAHIEQAQRRKLEADKEKNRNE